MNIKQIFCWHSYQEDGNGYILFDGWGVRYGEQAKIKSKLRKCIKCQKSQYSLMWECGNGKKEGKWYRNKFPPLRKLRKCKYL